MSAGMSASSTMLVFVCSFPDSCRHHRHLSTSLPGQTLRRHPIFLLRAARNDLEHIIRQQPPQHLRLIPRRTHPYVALLIHHQGHQHRLTSPSIETGAGNGQNTKIGHA